MEKPRSRAEKDWLYFQRRLITLISNYIGTMIKDNKDYYESKIPLIIAGDLFDQWESPPELINLVIEGLKEIAVPIIAIEGQHDMPNHSDGQKEMSAYYTVELAGCFYDKDFLNKVVYHYYPWTYKTGMNGVQNISPVKHKNKMNIAVVHSYCYEDINKSIPNVSSLCHVSKYIKKFKGFDFVVVGDNHTPFVVEAENKDDPTIVNCGGIMNRASNEKEKPRYIYGLCKDKTVLRQRIEIPEKWNDEKDTVVITTSNTLHEVKGFFDENKVTVDSLNDMLMLMVKKHPKLVKKIMHEIIEEVQC